MPDGGVGLPQLGAVVAVEVPAGEGAAVVAHHHAVRVQHGHHLEHKQVPQDLEGAGSGDTGGRGSVWQCMCAQYSVHTHTGGHMKAPPQCVCMYSTVLVYSECSCAV